MNFRIPAILCLSLFIHAKKSFTQSRVEDSSLRQSAYLHTASVYYDQLGDQSVLNNGSRYEKYPYPFRLGSAYYPYDKFTPGSVVYDGITFDSFSLLYDELQQFLVILKDGYELQLVNERISTFTIAGHIFLRLSADSVNNGIPATRFYEELYQGPSRILKATYKNIQEDAFITDGIPKFMVSREDYFIKRDNRYVHVKYMEQLPDIFTNHKKELRRFIEKNNLHGEVKENMLIQVAVYYDQLAK
jgi:hypothetical protein